LGSRARDERVRLLAQLPAKSRAPLAIIGAALIYLAAAYLLVGRGLLGNLTGRIVSNGAGRDPTVMIWCLAWFPHALANHLNPFLSRAVWWPSGVNLAWMTSIPGAALLAWPMTNAIGPVASFNVLSFLALPAAAFTAFLLCRHLTGRNRAALLGGYVFGFSPYFLGQLQQHLNLILAFPIPLAALLTVRLLEGRLRARVFAPLLALVLALQFLFMLELFATLTAVGSVALLLGFAIGPEHWRIAVRRAASPIAVAYAMMGVLLAPYWYYLFAFGTAAGPIASAGGVSTDLLNFFVPTEASLFGAHQSFLAISSHFTFTPEAGGWIAWPLLAVIALHLRWRWRKPAGKVLVVMVILLAVATLGPRLRVDGRELFGLPWKIVEHIPLIKSALPGRLTMYIFLILGVMTAAVLAAPELPRLAKYALALAIVTFMQPNPDFGFWTTPIDAPGFFTHGIFAAYLHPDDTVVTIPYGNHSDCMLWQASTDFYFRMAGGYTGAVLPDDFLKWPIVNSLYWGGDIADATIQLGAFLEAHDVREVIAARLRPLNYTPILLALKDLSLAPTEVGGMVIYPLAAAKLAQYRNLKPLELEQRYDRDRFDRLLVAADRFLSEGGYLAELTPSRAAMVALIPRNWGIDSDIYTRDGLILGQWQRDRIQVGVVGSYEALTPLIADYRGDAAEVYFPFPHPLARPPKGNTFMRKLVMVFDYGGLKRAARRASSELPASATSSNPSIVER
jgi:hypothetical protein